MNSLVRVGFCTRGAYILTDETSLSLTMVKNKIKARDHSIRIKNLG